MDLDQEAWILLGAPALDCGEDIWLVSLVPSLRSRLQAQTTHGRVLAVHCLNSPTVAAVDLSIYSFLETL